MEGLRAGHQSRLPGPSLGEGTSIGPRRGGGRDPHRAGPAGPTTPSLASAPAPGAGWFRQVSPVGSGPLGTPGTPSSYFPFTGPLPGPPRCSDSARGGPPHPVPACSRDTLGARPGPVSQNSCIRPRAPWPAGPRSHQPQPSPTTAWGSPHPSRHPLVQGSCLTDHPDQTPPKGKQTPKPKCGQGQPSHSTRAHLPPWGALGRQSRLQPTHTHTHTH